MRHPWQHGAGSGDELEALQTDVMRFIAILGLCLVAIFSLVNGAQQEQVIAQQLPAPAPQVEPRSNPAESKPVALEPPPAPVPVKPDSSAPEPGGPGYTLEFESAEALRSLLAGGHVQLYAVVDDAFNRYHPDGVFQPARAPASYYQMDQATVPRRLHLQASSLYGDSVSWGVILPATAVRDIQQMVSAGEGGNLLISGDASVRLVGDENREQ